MPDETQRQRIQAGHAQAVFVGRPADGEVALQQPAQEEGLDIGRQAATHRRQREDRQGSQHHRPAAQRVDALKARHSFKTEMDEQARKFMYPQNERLAKH